MLPDTPLGLSCARRERRAARLALRVAIAWLCTIGASQAEIALAPADDIAPLTISADRASRWRQGAYDVWWLEGRVNLAQGPHDCRSHSAVLWIKAADPNADVESEAARFKIIAYLEGDVQLATGRTPDGATPASNAPQGQGWLGNFYSMRPPVLRTPPPGAEPAEKPPVFERAMAQRDPYGSGAIRRTQFTQFDNGPAPTETAPPGTRRLRIFPRSTVPIQAEWIPDQDRKRGVALISNGVNLIVDGLPQIGQIDVSTDRMVIWTAGSLNPSTSETLQQDNTPLEIYMEGNIVFRQGDRVIYADRMYYDVNTKTGTVLHAEVYSPFALPRSDGIYRGLVRLRSELIQQTGPDRFLAHDSFITTSRMAQPGYRVQAGDIYFEDYQRPVVDRFTGAPLLDPSTGEQVIAHERQLTSDHNVLFAGPAPVFYWPRFTTDLEDGNFLIRSVELQNDQVFGFWGTVNLDAWQLLGVNRKPKGTNWRVGFDALSERGFGGGTTFQYQRDEFFGLPGPTTGLIDAWALGDSGFDRLGAGRMHLTPESEPFRGKLLGRHRQQLPEGFQFSAEVGWISDRNFLEQYFEADWDTRKDQTTGVELKKITDNRSWSITADGRVNDFFTQTNWLPRGDHFWLGQSLVADSFSFYSHSSAGYAQLKTASTPTDPADAAQFKLLPWEVESSGGRFVTTNEIDLPFDVGPVKFVPYGLGQLAHWGQDLTGSSMDRAFGQVGLRASIPFWTANPNVENTLFNVHGVAHKVVLDAEVSYADATQDASGLPLYDPLDDDAQEHFRRRFAFNTFGGTTPAQFDERFYALRTGLQNWVTSPSAEIADDLAAVRFGVRQRWQTKRGAPGRRRIIDWILLDTQAVYFPSADRDNFGHSLGLVDYDFRWHVGDRLTLLSDGAFDYFDRGQRTVSVGLFMTRPPRSSWYVGLRSLGGPLNFNVFNTSYTYRLSPKWVSTAGTSFALGGQGTIGQTLALTRVGESFLTSFAFNVDSGKDNVGVMFMIEPRFGPRTRLGRVGGAQIPVAGLYGLE